MASPQSLALGNIGKHHQRSRCSGVLFWKASAGIALDPVTTDIISTNQSLSESAPRRAAAWFLILWIISLAAFRVPLTFLIELAWRDDQYTYILLVPLISAFLIWLKRGQISTESTCSPRRGLLLGLAGILLSSVSIPWPAINLDWSLAAAIFAVVLVWVAIGCTCYGVRTLRSAVFPMLFLCLMIPLPASVMNQVVTALQKGSAEGTALLFRLSGVPFSRDGVNFSLPIVDIQIGTECSGIRSATALLISGILASHLFIRSGWRRLGFVLLIIPVVIFKNAVRIATISWLALHVDASFLSGNLHHRGGLVFSPLAVAILLPVLIGLRRMEEHSGRPSVSRLARSIRWRRKRDPAVQSQQRPCSP